MLLCKHDECEHKKRLKCYALYDFIPKCKRRKKIKIKKHQTQTENNNNKNKLNIIAKLGFEPRLLAWKARFIATGVLYHMDS